MYFLVSHVVFHGGVPIYGPIHVLETFLKKTKRKYTLVSLPLEMEGNYSIQRSGNKKNVTFPSKHQSFLLKLIYDFYFLFRFLFSVGISSADTVIAANPLNALPFALAKVFRRFKLVYYTVDYSDRRFPQWWLNLIYRACDLVSLLICDENWCVSETIIVKRAEQGFGKKAKFVPNVPVLPMAMKKQNQSQKNRLVYVGRMDKNMNLLPLLKAVAKLHSKNENISLTLIGDGVLRGEVEKHAGRHSFIQFLGPLENKFVIEQVRRSGIGIALYDGGNDWNRYGDSMKLREYQYFGLPVLTTGIPANSGEVREYDCGIVLNEKGLAVNDIVRSVMEIQNNFSSFSKNAHRLAQDRNKEVILEELLQL